MRSGFACSDQDFGTTFDMMASPDWAQFTLDLPMAAEPGSIWKIQLTSAKGLWETDNVFVAHIDEFANEGHHKFRFSLAFEGDQVTVEMWQDGTLAGTLIGRVEE